MSGTAVEGVDLDRLADWMDGQGIAAGPISDIELLAGGTQNILLRFHAWRRAVRAAPPAHPQAGQQRRDDASRGSRPRRARRGRTCRTPR